MDHKDSSVLPVTSVKKSPYSRNQYKTSRTSTAMTQAAFSTSEEKHRSPSACAKQPKTGTSGTPKTVQCYVGGISFPATAIRDSRKVFRDFAGRILHWKVLARFLKVSASDVQNIDRMYEFQNEKCFQMLCSWQKQSGNGATYIKLAEGFEEVKQESLIKDLHGHIQPSVAEATSSINSYKAEIDIDSSDDVLKFNRDFFQFISDGKNNGSRTASIQIELR